MKTEMVDLKRKPPKKGDKMVDVPMEVGGYDKYPYGTRLCFGNEELDKLGISINGMSTGDEVSIKAQAKIVSLEERETEGSEKQMSLDLQITKIALSSENSFKGGFDEEDE